jgi:hypothetical protein
MPTATPTPTPTVTPVPGGELPTTGQPGGGTLPGNGSQSWDVELDDGSIYRFTVVGTVTVITLIDPNGNVVSRTEQTQRAGGGGGVGRDAQTLTLDYQPTVAGTYRLVVTSGPTGGGYQATARVLPQSEMGAGELTWYFAEGYATADFDEYLTLLNPNGTAAELAITYYGPAGVLATRTAVVPATSRVTVAVHEAGQLGRAGEHGTRVSSTNGVGVVAERLLYGRYRHNGIAADGGSAVLGAPHLSTTWYFSEGYTAPNFDQYLLLLNPTAAEAPVTLTYYLSDGNTIEKNLTLPAQSRRTVAVHETALGVGRGRAVAARVVSTGGAGIVAERSLYFAYSGAIDGLATALGVLAPHRTWYLAEGYTAPGYDEYLTLLNPHAGAAEVTLTYYLADGTTATKALTVAATSRATVAVHDEALGVGRGKEVAVKVTTAHPDGIVVERPIYFVYMPAWADGGGALDGGHVAPGVTGARPTWYFAEGNTGAGFDQYLTILNPDGAVAEVAITYYLADGTTSQATLTVAPTSRATVAVHGASPGAGRGRVLGAKVASTNGRSLVVERPLYFRYASAIDGGHAGPGYGSN